MTLGLAYFSHFGGKNVIFKKAGSVMHNIIWAPKKTPSSSYRANSKKSSRQDGQTLFIAPFWPRLLVQ